MKKYIQILCLFILLASCISVEKKPDKLLSILNNISTSSYFIAIDVKCSNEVFPIIDTNNSLFLMLRKRGIIKDQNDYIVMMLRLLKNNEPIFFTEKDREVLKSCSVTKNDSLDISLKSDKDAFWDKYFENNRFKSEEFSFDQAKAVIYYLFKNGIYCKRDCNSGYVFIDSKTNNN